MTERQAENFWWDGVAGPRMLVRGIVDAIIECKSVVLTVPTDLPWRHQMRDSVRNAMELTPGLDGLFIEQLDIEEEGQHTIPGDLVLQRLALFEDRIHYRSGLETVLQYASRKGFLANKVVLVKGMDAEETSEWIDFCRQWHPHSPEQGVFIIEDRWSIGDPTGSLEAINYAECIDENSVRLFAWSMIAEQKHGNLTSMWRKYAVSLLTNLCKDDVEVAYALMNEFDIQSDDPLENMNTLSKSPVFARRGELEPNNVLALARMRAQDELSLRVWMAQVETLFPAIEEARLSLVDHLKEDLSDLLEGEGIEQFGESVNDVRDVELGTIVRLMSRGADGGRKLYVHDERTRDRIFLLWRCRNLLAHRAVCSPETVRKLLSFI